MMAIYMFDPLLGFYILIDNLCLDKTIATYLNIKLETYQNKLIEEGNGYFAYNRDVYFKTDKNTEILDWINSLIIINKLGEVRYD
jgi:hypothetical protein